MALPADYTDLTNDGVISGFNQTTLHYRGNNTPAGPLKHKEVDSNFELLRQKVNAAGAGNNALKTIYGDTVSAAASATAANSSKVAAQTANGQAQQYASNASSSASSASTSASNASTSASNASSSASSASSSASSASTSASSASSSASTATARANEIKSLTAATGSPGTNASYNSGTGVLTVPRGYKGDKGDEGDKGDKGNTGATPTFSFSGGTLTITNV
jgi:hypothetical protein